MRPAILSGGIDFDAGWLQPFQALLFVRAVMTSRRGGNSLPPYDAMNLRAGIGDDPSAVAHNLSRLQSALGAPPVLLEQVHGCRVVRLTLSDAVPGAASLHADACVSTDPRLPCTVLVADCLPVLFATVGGARPAVAAAHAGWRGLAVGVLEATVAELCAAATCAPADIHAWLGPCIGPERFEVGDDVLSAFDSQQGARHFAAQASGRWLADLPGLARDRLVGVGVRRIEGGSWCTHTAALRWYSYRRDGVTGRMAAAIRLV